VFHFIKKKFWQIFKIAIYWVHKKYEILKILDFSLIFANTIFLVFCMLYLHNISTKQSKSCWNV